MGPKGGIRPAQAAHRGQNGRDGGEREEATTTSVAHVHPPSASSPSPSPTRHPPAFPPTPGRGLHSDGWQCHTNTIIHSLAAAPVFSAAATRWKQVQLQAITTETRRCVCDMLYEAVAAIHNGADGELRPMITRPESYAQHKLATINQQEDVDTVWNRLTSKMYDCVINHAEEDQTRSLLRMEIQHHTCPTCTVVPMDQPAHLLLQTTEQHLQSAINRGDLQHFVFSTQPCSVCNNALQPKSITRSPKVLVLHQSYAHGAIRQAKLPPELSLDLSPVLADEARTEEGIYHLCSITAHVRGAVGRTTGHYITFCRLSDGLWALMDDANAPIILTDDQLQRTPMIRAMMIYEREAANPHRAEEEELDGDNASAGSGPGYATMVSSRPTRTPTTALTNEELRNAMRLRNLQMALLPAYPRGDRHSTAERPVTQPEISDAPTHDPPSSPCIDSSEYLPYILAATSEWLTWAKGVHERWNDLYKQNKSKRDTRPTACRLEEEVDRLSFTMQSTLRIIPEAVVPGWIQAKSVMLTELEQLFRRETNNKLPLGSTEATSRAWILMEYYGACLMVPRGTLLNGTARTQKLTPHLLKLRLSNFIGHIGTGIFGDDVVSCARRAWLETYFRHEAMSEMTRRQQQQKQRENYLTAGSHPYPTTARAAEMARKEEESRDRSLAAAIEMSICNEKISQACSKLLKPSSPPVITDEIIQKLQDLHPKRQPCNPIMQMPEASRLAACDRSFLPEHLQKLSRSRVIDGKAPGPNGLVGAHYYCLFQTDIGSRVLSLMCTAIARGSLHPILAEWVTSSRLVGLAKTNDRGEMIGVRPIAMQQYLMRLTIKLTMTIFINQQVLRDFFPVAQMCMHFSGTERVIHLLNMLVEHSEKLGEEWAIKAYDVVNAFNRTFRKATSRRLYAEDSLLPLHPIYDLNHTQERPLMIFNAISLQLEAVIASSEGVRQGDGAAMFLFALTLQPVLEAVSAALSPPPTASTTPPPSPAAQQPSGQAADDGMDMSTSPLPVTQPPRDEDDEMETDEDHHQPPPTRSQRLSTTAITQPRASTTSARNSIDDTATAPSDTTDLSKGTSSRGLAPAGHAGIANPCSSPTHTAPDGDVERARSARRGRGRHTTPFTAKEKTSGLDQLFRNNSEREEVPLRHSNSTAEALGDSLTTGTYHNITHHEKAPLILARGGSISSASRGGMTENPQTAMSIMPAAPAPSGSNTPPLPLELRRIIEEDESSATHPSDSESLESVDNEMGVDTTRPTAPTSHPVANSSNQQPGSSSNQENTRVGPNPSFSVCAAFADDIHVKGTIAQIELTDSILVPGLAEIGLEVNPQKCKLCVPNRLSDDERVQQGVHDRHYSLAEDLLPVLGSYVGCNKQSIAALLEAKVSPTSSLVKALHRLQRLPLLTQTKMILLRGCLSLKMSYWMRTVQPTYLDRAASIFDELMCKTAVNILDIDEATERSTQLDEQLSRHLRHGGMGVLRVRSSMDAAYLASVMTAVVAHPTQYTLLDKDCETILAANTAWTRIANNLGEVPAINDEVERTLLLSSLRTERELFTDVMLHNTTSQRRLAYMSQNAEYMQTESTVRRASYLSALAVATSSSSDERIDDIDTEQFIDEDGSGGSGERHDGAHHDAFDVSVPRSDSLPTFRNVRLQFVLNRRLADVRQVLFLRRKHEEVTRRNDLRKETLSNRSSTQDEKARMTQAHLQAQIAQVRAICLNDPVAASLFLIIPSERELRLHDNAYHTAVRIRLGLPPVVGLHSCPFDHGRGRNIAFAQRGGNAAYTIDPSHWLACVHCLRTMYSSTIRHNHVANAIVDMAREALCEATLLPDILDLVEQAPAYDRDALPGATAPSSVLTDLLNQRKRLSSAAGQPLQALDPSAGSDLTFSTLTGDNMEEEEEEFFTLPLTTHQRRLKRLVGDIALSGGSLRRINMIDVTVSAPAALTHVNSFRRSIQNTSLRTPNNASVAPHLLKAEDIKHRHYKKYLTTCFPSVARTAILDPNIHRSLSLDITAAAMTVYGNIGKELSALLKTLAINATARTLQDYRAESGMSKAKLSLSAQQRTLRYFRSRLSIALARGISASFSSSLVTTGISWGAS